MNKATLRAVEAIVVLAVLAACQGKPIPTTVVPGTTFVLPITAYGYGNDVSRSQGIKDYQRGEMVMVLCPIATPNCTPPTTTPSPCPTPRPNPPTQGYYLASHWVTSVMPSPASDAGQRGYLRSTGYGTTPYGIMGQDIAFLDVHPNTCPGLYTISQRVRGPDDNVGTEALVSSLWAVRVVDAPPGTPNTNTSTVGGSTGDPPSGLEVQQGPDMSDLVPNPTVHLRLNQPGWAVTYPAAAEVEVTYPSDKVVIQGAYQDKHLGLKSMVNTIDNPNFDVPNHRGKVTIQVVDPTRCTEDMKLVFKLASGQTTAVNAVTDFSTASQRLYDQNGAPLTQNLYIISSGPYTTGVTCGS